MTHRDEGCFPPTFEFLESQLFDDELHPSLVPILPVAQLVEDFDDGFDARNELVHRREFTKHLGDTGRGAQSAAGHHSEPDGAVCLLCGQQADIVNRCQSAVVLAAGEGDFEFARQTLIEGVPKQMICDGLRIGRHVKDLGLADPCQMARSDVADGIGAGLPGRQADFRQPSHDGRDVFQLDEMQLNVLSRCHVAHPGRVPIRQFSNPPELIGSQTAERNLDAHHLHARLALTVNAVLQPKRLEEIIDELAGD